MDKFGNVDLVVADVNEDEGVVREFVSVELQAVDLTGSVASAYTGLLEGTELVDVTYGVNWANVRKRYVEQLITKCFYHHQWGTRVVSVMQSPLYSYIRRHIQFLELDAYNPNVDVIFLLYDYKNPTAQDQSTFQLAFDRAVGTTHNSLMSNTLYQIPPPKEVFAARVFERLV